MARCNASPCFNAGLLSKGRPCFNAGLLSKASSTIRCKPSLCFNAGQHRARVLRFKSPLLAVALFVSRQSQHLLKALPNSSKHFLKALAMASASAGPDLSSSAPARGGTTVGTRPHHRGRQSRTRSKTEAQGMTTKFKIFPEAEAAVSRVAAARCGVTQDSNDHKHPMSQKCFGGCYSHISLVQTKLRPYQRTAPDLASMKREQGDSVRKRKRSMSLTQEEKNICSICFKALDDTNQSRAQIDMQSWKAQQGKSVNVHKLRCQDCVQEEHQKALRHQKEKHPHPEGPAECATCGSTDISRSQRKKRRGDRLCTQCVGSKMRSAKVCAGH